MTTINFDSYDFIDFGCSDGGSMRFAMDALGGRRGVGLDIDPQKVAKACAAGFEAIEMDVTQLKSHPNAVSFVLMQHFLEHLPGYHLATKCVHAGIETARDFVVLRQPWFDHDGLLALMGLKCFWSDWTGHTFSLTSLDMVRMLRSAKAPRWRLYGIRPIAHSSDQMILPLDAAPDQHKYNSGHGPKPHVPLPPGVYAELMAVIIKSPTLSFDDLEQRLPAATQLEVPSVRSSGNYSET